MPNDILGISIKILEAIDDIENGRVISEEMWTELDNI